ncbi:mitochondrial outer membrane protein, partial [Eremomyces bilateralis CBS 781.70]|uniref:Mitochondrial outer membrane protein n=2 Tax=Eremomyces bilateralis CBS 781.70 TaxID=1392243 RepID=A0A6J3N1Q4_9PEZI
MASPLDEDVFDRLKHTEEQAKKAEELNARLHSQYEKAQARQAEVIGSNTTLPVTISSVRVLNAQNTRKGFLHGVFRPFLEANKKEYYTLSDALEDIGIAHHRLRKFDIFRDPISVYIDRPDPTDPSTTPTDIDVYFSVKERSRYTIKTGTEVGHADGSGYASANLRNLFGGAETLTANASVGIRTRSAYSAAFETPILSNPDFSWEVAGLASSTLKSWASHEEALKGGFTKLKWQTLSGAHKHEFGYSGLWRQITSLASNASPTVRADAGDSFKSALTHTWTHDLRDSRTLPSRGYLVKTVSELAGLGPLRGDVAFAKLEGETQAAIPIPIPGIKGDSGVSLTAGFRGGVLYPLALGGSGNNLPVHSRLSDRFQLGGPTDVRGFRLGGLGPRDGPDAVGGDVYAAAGASLLVPFPRAGPETPLRFQAFVNAGRLLALRKSKGGESSMDNAAVAESVKQTIRELADGLPSCSAGVGIVYAHPVARFELNFSLPLVARKGEDARKGISFGVGMEFL